MGGLPADQCDRDVPHRRIGLCAMPMAFTGLDVHDVTDIDFALLTLGCNHAGAGGHDQHLLAAMGMPSGTLPTETRLARIFPGIAGSR